MINHIAPSGTPQVIIQAIYTEMLKAIQTKELREKIASEGAEPIGSSPNEFATHIKTEYQKWSAVAKRAGIEPQ